MNIPSVDFISFYYFQTLLHDGTEYRFCYSTHALGALLDLRSGRSITRVAFAPG
jgi:hypothetical protein